MCKDNIWAYSVLSQMEVLFSVTPFKIHQTKIKTGQQMKFRIWEKKEGKYAKSLAKIWKIQVTAIFLSQDMLRYLSADMYIICSEKRTVFWERSSRETVSFEEQIHFRAKWMLLCLLSLKHFSQHAQFWKLVNILAGYFLPGGGGGYFLIRQTLMGMCRWTGSHIHDWIDFHGVAFSIELPEWGRTFSDFWGTTALHI